MKLEQGSEWSQPWMFAAEPSQPDLRNLSGFAINNGLLPFEPEPVPEPWSVLEDADDYFLSTFLNLEPDGSLWLQPEIDCSKSTNLEDATHANLSNPTNAQPATVHPKLRG